jgi:hypothetical protein
MAGPRGDLGDPGFQRVGIRGADQAILQEASWRHRPDVPGGVTAPDPPSRIAAGQVVERGVIPYGHDAPPGASGIRAAGADRARTALLATRNGWAARAGSPISRVAGVRVLILTSFRVHAANATSLRAVLSQHTFATVFCTCFCSLHLLC